MENVLQSVPEQSAAQGVKNHLKKYDSHDRHLMSTIITDALSFRSNLDTVSDLSGIKSDHTRASLGNTDMVA
jgi:hypothetical protein